jgi:hypothetical protein
VLVHKGLRITTNSISQLQNRPVVAWAREHNVGVVWTIPDHPWVDESDAAAVRVAITVIADKPQTAVRAEVDNLGVITKQVEVPGGLNEDLSAAIDVVSAAQKPLRANQNLSGRGVILRGSGFVVDRSEAAHLTALDTKNSKVLKPFYMGRDIVDQPRGLQVIDLGRCTEQEARSYPTLFDIVRDRVWPERKGKAEASAREFWWQFWRTRDEFRTALHGMSRYIITPYVSKHRFFIFVDQQVVPDDTVVGIAVQDALILGVLSSTIHIVWALTAGTTLEDRPRYNNTTCFDAFPFPKTAPELGVKIATLTEQLDRHRKDALARNPKVTMTGMYNVVEKFRRHDALTPKEREIHQIAACGVLRDLHEQLDALVAQAYGWSWPLEREEILERLVALHDERTEEERNGSVHWLRPEYQVSRLANSPALQMAPNSECLSSSKRQIEDGKLPWPAKSAEQIAAIFSLISSESFLPREVAALFDNARAELIQRHLETLAMVGEVRMNSDGRYQAVGIAA